MIIRSEALLIGGRAGVGKTSVAQEIHAQLCVRGVRHCVIEGDNLDLAYPPPWEYGLAERNLAAMWRNYRELGYRRMVYTNTVSVKYIDVLAAAMGDDPRITAVLLRADDTTAHQRLAQREIGSGLAYHVERSDLMARDLEETVAPSVLRVETNGRSISDIAGELIGLAGWADPRLDGGRDDLIGR